METRCCTILFANYINCSKKEIGWRYSLSYRRHGENEEKQMFVLLTRLHAAELLVLSRWKVSTRWSKTAHATIGLRSRHRIDPRPTRFVSGKASECRWRPRRDQVDPWPRGREVARGVLRSFPKPKKKSFFAIGERSKNVVACFLHSSAQMCLYQTPGRHPPPITGRFVNTATVAFTASLNYYLV